MAAKAQNIGGIWWLVVHHKGRRRKKRFGPTVEDGRAAKRAAEELNHRLALGLYESPEKPAPEPAPIPFEHYALNWLRREVDLPIELDQADHLAPGTAHQYSSNVRAHLVPYFGSRDLRAI